MPQKSKKTAAAAIQHLREAIEKALVGLSPTDIAVTMTAIQADVHGLLELVQDVKPRADLKVELPALTGACDAT